MKNLVFLVAFVATMGLSAQSTLQMGQKMDADGVRSRTIVLTDSMGQPIKQALAPVADKKPLKTRPTSGQGTKSATAKANSGVAKIGDKITINGVEKILCEDGQLHVKGESVYDQDGNRHKVMSDGTLEFVTGPSPAPAPAPTATPAPAQVAGQPVLVQGDAVVPPHHGPNGEVLVYDPITKTYDLPKGVKEVMIAQAKAATGGGDQTTASTTDAKDGLFQLESGEGKPWYYRDGGGVPHMVEERPYTVHQGRKDVLIGNPNSIAQQDLAHQVVQTRSYYDDTNNPTVASNIQAANNGGAGNSVNVDPFGVSRMITRVRNYQISTGGYYFPEVTDGRCHGGRMR